MITGQRILLSIALGLALSAAGWEASSSPQAQVLDPRFGVIEPHDAAEQADALGVAWGRARFHWALVQPRGPDEWIDAEFGPVQLAREQQAGREVIGLLIGIPDWARDDNGLPRGLYLPYSDPGNTWAGYVRQAVTRYRGQIDHWIIWNEPDVWDADHPAFTWPGDEADYLQLLKVAYFTAKQANPNAVIHLAAFSHWWDVQHNRELYFKRFLGVLIADPQASEFDYYYDVATLHLYFNPASVYEIIEQYQAIQAEHGIDKPFWLIETNAAPSSDPAWPVADPTFRISLLEQAAYMPQGLALALAAGAERVGIYKLIDTPGDYAANPEPFGLVRADGSPRPAFTTARVAIHQLAGMEHIVWVDRHTVAQVAAERPGRLTRLLWSRLPIPQNVKVPAFSDSATLVDMWGNESHIEPMDGFYTLTLLGGECQQTTGDYCMIGGPPVYLNEDVPPDVDIDPPSVTVIDVPFQPKSIAVESSRLLERVLTPVLIGSLTLLAMGGGRHLFRSSGVNHG